MSLQFNNNLKLFITTNLDLDGNINTTGFNADNTKQLVPTKGSFRMEQSRSYSYVDNSNLIDTTTSLNATAKASLSLGSVGFSTLLNSSPLGPSDLWLWNYLVSEEDYPNSRWSSSPGAQTFNLARTSNNLASFGLIAVSGTTTYLLSGVRVSSVNLSINTSELISVEWSLNFTGIMVLNDSVSLNQTKINEYSFTGGLIGTAEKLILDIYKYSVGKFIRTTLLSPAGVSLGSLATISGNMSVTNSLSYADSEGMEVSQFTKLFAGAGEEAVTGSLSFYTRSTSGTLRTLIEELAKIQSDPYTYSSYGLKLEFMGFNSSSTLIEITLIPCNITYSTSFDSAITNTINYKLVYSSLNNIYSIKFYT